MDIEVENQRGKNQLDYQIVTSFIHNSDLEIFPEIIRKHYLHNVLSVSYDNGELLILDSENFEIKNKSNIFSGSIVDHQWCFDNFIIASSGNKLSLFDLQKNKAISTYNGHSDTILSLKPLFLTNVIASSGFDRTIMLWDIRDSKPFHVILSHSSAVNSLDFSYDNKMLMSTAGDGYCRLWSMFNYKSIKTLMVDNNAFLTNANFSFNNKYALVSSLNSGISLFNIESAEIISNYKGHQNEEFLIENCFGCINNKQNLIISGSENGKIYIWDLLTKEIIVEKTIIENNKNNNLTNVQIDLFSENTDKLYISMKQNKQLFLYKKT